MDNISAPKNNLPEHQSRLSSLWRRLIVTFGPLRVVLLALLSVAIVGAAFAGGEVELTFPAIVPTLIAPPFAVMMAFITALDILMTAVFLNAKVGAEKTRLRTVALVEIIGLVVLIVVWSAFFSTIGRPA
jgi:nitrate reductase NapE component